MDSSGEAGQHQRVESGEQDEYVSGYIGRIAVRGGDAELAEDVPWWVSTVGYLMTSRLTVIR
jgi:hypothetical protein